MVPLHQITAALYLVAGLVAGAGLALPAPRLGRISVALLALGALVHGAAFATLHRVDPPPPLTDLPAAMSFMAWIGTLFYLLLMLRARLVGLVVLVAPMAFLGAFFAALRLPAAEPAAFWGSGSWPHAHVLLASAGLSMLGVAALAGVLYLTEHRRLKSKHLSLSRFPLPSLEALDRTNAVALALGFPLLTLGVVTGMLWVQAVSGTPWTATAHQTWTVIAWAVYAVVAGARFVSNQGARQAAVSAVAGFAFLFFAVIGVGLFA